jgi:cytoplasmic iron level regulating protein YaaA (DUF328/UPF0246 family)
MLYLLSPAKSLDYETPPGAVPHTLPQFVPQSQALIEVLRQKSPQQIAELMDLSDATKPGAPSSRLKTPNKPFWPLTAMFTKGWTPRL